MSTPDDEKTESRPRVVCWGEVLWDCFPGGVLRLGGAPANVAYHLAALGERVSLASRVGDDDLGRRARAALARCGVGVDTVQIDCARPTGRVRVELTDGEPSYTLTPGCAWEHIEVTPAVERALAGAAAVCFGTLSQRVEIAAFTRALSRAPRTCLRVCDVNLRPRFVDAEVLRVALASADVVKLNRDEARIIAERFGVVDAPAWLLSDMGVGMVALTRGARGSVFLCADGSAIDHPGHAARPGVDDASVSRPHAAAEADNVGAGDAFTAVLVRMLVDGQPLPDIADAANRYAAIIASLPGATPDVPAEIIAGLGV